MNSDLNIHVLPADQRFRSAAQLKPFYNPGRRLGAIVFDPGPAEEVAAVDARVVNQVLHGRSEARLLGRFACLLSEQRIILQVLQHVHGALILRPQLIPLVVKPRIQIWPLGQPYRRARHSKLLANRLHSHTTLHHRIRHPTHHELSPIWSHNPPIIYHTP